MKLTKSLAILLAVTLAFAALAMAASADGTATVVAGTYEIISPTAIELTATGAGATAAPKGGGTLMDLADGNVSRDVTTFDSKGVVLIVNDFVAKSPDRASGVVHQEEIQSFSFEMDFGKSVSFDTAYIAIYYEVAVGIPSPADNCVIVETSKDGKVWVPVGADGTYYYNLKPTEDYEDGKGKPFVAEVAVPLGEKVTSQYVRYTFSFQVIPEGYHWTYYTNVYEFCGFTEIGVANFKEGREATAFDAEDVAEWLDIRDTWLMEEEDTVTVVEIENINGLGTWKSSTYDKATYGEEGAEATDSYEANWEIEGDTVIVWDADGYDEYTAALGEDDTLTLELDGEELSFIKASAYNAGNGTDTPDESSADETPSEDTKSEATSTAASTATSSAAQSGSAATSSNAGTSGSTSDEGGLSTGVIVGIVIAVVVVIAVAVSIIIGARKKKQ